MTSSNLTSDDWRAMLTLVGEIGELSASSDAACSHFMSGLAGLIGCGPVWWSVIGGSDASAAQSDDGVADVTRSRVHGLAPETLQRWERSYLETRAYGEHPTWEPAFATPGIARCFLRRDIVHDHVWYNSPHVMEYSRSFDADDLVSAIVPIGGGAELCVVGMRNWGDTGFTAREREILLLLAQHTAWLAQRPDPLVSLARGKLAAPVTVAQLAPRHRAVLELLAAGRSEKQIAAALTISPRTAHKYIEQIYRALGVSSRAELMARFIAR
ncbi:response regulator transcription factor [Bradyrhizobium sp. HKCCYLS2038]|uniref:helix-turn-helix transcriptional regulator n=1 Tax=unclassified Bradyrhizobium TaxID=2631580 RepID=UPI003EB82A1F